MEKERKVKPFVFLFLIVLFGLNLLFFLRKKDNIYGSVTGMFVKGTGNTITDLSSIAFIMQWVILISVIIFAYTRFLKHKREEAQKIENFSIPPKSSTAETDMDIFYNLLKEKKNLSVGTIARLFNIPKEKALEWAKILEDHDLATIEYPAFSNAEVNIKEEEIGKKLKNK